MERTKLNWFRAWYSGGLLWIRRCTLGISRTAEWLLPC